MAFYSRVVVCFQSPKCETSTRSRKSLHASAALCLVSFCDRLGDSVGSWILSPGVSWVVFGWPWVSYGCPWVFFGRRWAIFGLLLGSLGGPRWSSGGLSGGPGGLLAVSGRPLGAAGSHRGDFWDVWTGGARSEGSFGGLSAVACGFLGSFWVALGVFSVPLGVHWVSLGGLGAF